MGGTIEARRVAASLGKGPHWRFCEWVGLMQNGAQPPSTPTHTPARALFVQRQTAKTVLFTPTAVELFLSLSPYLPPLTSLPPLLNRVHLTTDRRICGEWRRDSVVKVGGLSMLRLASMPTMDRALATGGMNGWMGSGWIG
jgi:hypothetical protein